MTKENLEKLSLKEKIVVGGFLTVYGISQGVNGVIQEAKHAYYSLRGINNRLVTSEEDPDTSFYYYARND